MPWNTRALSSTTKSDYNDETLLSLSPKKKAMPQLTRTSRQLRHRLHFGFGRCPHETLQNPSGYFELSMSFYVASSKCHPMPAFFAQCSWCAIVMRLSCFPKNWKPPFKESTGNILHYFTHELTLWLSLGMLCWNLEVAGVKNHCWIRWWKTMVFLSCFYYQAIVLISHTRKSEMSHISPKKSHEIAHFASGLTDMARQAWCDHHELPLEEADFLLGSWVLKYEDRAVVYPLGFVGWWWLMPFGNIGTNEKWRFNGT